MEKETQKQETKPKTRQRKQKANPQTEGLVVELKSGKKAVISEKAAVTLKKLGFLK